MDATRISRNRVVVVVSEEGRREGRMTHLAWIAGGWATVENVARRVYCYTSPLFTPDDRVSLCLTRILYRRGNGIRSRTNYVCNRVLGCMIIWSLTVCLHIQSRKRQTLGFETRLSNDSLRNTPCSQARLSLRV